MFFLTPLAAAQPAPTPTPIPDGEYSLGKRALRALADLELKESQSLAETPRAQKQPGRVTTRGVPTATPLRKGDVIHPFVPGRPNVPPPDPIFTLSTPATSYKLGEPLSLVLTLSGGPPDTYPYSYYWAVCTFAPGVITVAYLKRDGTSVQPAGVTARDFPDSVSNLEETSLLPLPPGMSIDIPFPVGRTTLGAARFVTGGTHGAYSLVIRDPLSRTVRTIDVPAFQASVYAFDQRGSYVLKLRYKYTGSFVNAPGGFIFPGHVESNEVAFSIE
jgi:hypothetical protein